LISNGIFLFKVAIYYTLISIYKEIKAMAKKLLKEATVRRFQRLANVAPINEMYHKRDEEEMEEGMYAKRDDEEVMKEEEEEAAEAPEAAMDMGGEEEAMDGDLELTDEEAQAIIDLGNKLQGAMGDEPEMEMGDEEPMDMDMGDEKEVMEMDMEEDLMEALAGIDYVPSQGEIVNEVAKRVAYRLKQAKLHEAKLNRALGKRR
jgi:hypothetical protein